MKMLLVARFPTETFNAAVRDGTAGKKTEAILDALKPEAVYFTELEGKRTAIMIVNLESPSAIPALAEPLFLTFNAEVELRTVMTREELGAAGLVALGKKWG